MTEPNRSPHERQEPQESRSSQPADGTEEQDYSRQRPRSIDLYPFGPNPGITFGRE